MLLFEFKDNLIKFFGVIKFWEKFGISNIESFVFVNFFFYCLDVLLFVWVVKCYGGDISLVEVFDDVCYDFSLLCVVRNCVEKILIYFRVEFVVCCWGCDSSDVVYL